MNRRGILFVISGPSGVGKGTLREKLMETPLDGLIYSISATTRKPRSGEVDGRDYFFSDIQSFESLIAEGELLEWALVYNNYYGTPKRFVMDNLEKGTDVLLEIDIQGALRVKSLIPDGVFVFVLPPSVEELGKRLNARGKDSQSEIQHRLACYEEEISHVGDYDYVVVNDDVSEATEKIRAIIIAERCSAKRLL
ncbi:MAG: guanylate kinase [Syntrophomonadales bacterium]|jgi:guanylate kinase